MNHRIDAVHPDVANALRARSGMERLRLAHETWELVRDRLAAYVASRHPEWRPETIQGTLHGHGMIIHHTSGECPWER